MATIKDVAREAGLNVGTVSRVLNNRGYISDEAREKVNAAMEKLDYRPNELARSLIKQANNTLGVIVPHIVHPYFAKLISNLESEAARLGYKILLCNSKADTEREREYIEMFRSNRVAGIILCSASVSVEKLKNLGLPVITIERNGEVATAGIDCDNYMGGELAAQHLIDCGCKSLLHFSGLVNVDMPADRRADAFTAVCERRGVACKVLKSAPGDYYNMEYQEYVRQALLDNKGVDGIFASSDVIAAQVLKCCAELGIAVPGALRLVGFDDVNIASLCTPSITTIRQPVREMAALAIEFVRKFHSGDVIPTQTVLPVTLVKRQTT